MKLKKKKKIEKKPRKNTCNIHCLLVLDLTRVASKTLKGAVKMLEKYIGTRSEHCGEIRERKLQHTFLKNERNSLCWKHSLSPPAENEMQSHGRRG